MTREEASKTIEMLEKAIRHFENTQNNCVYESEQYWRLQDRIAALAEAIEALK